MQTGLSKHQSFACSFFFSCYQLCIMNVCDHFGPFFLSFVLLLQVPIRFVRWLVGFAVAARIYLGSSLCFRYFTVFNSSGSFFIRRITSVLVIFCVQDKLSIFLDSQSSKRTNTSISW